MYTLIKPYLNKLKLICLIFKIKATVENQNKNFSNHHNMLFETMKKAADRKSLMTCAINVSIASNV